MRINPLQQSDIVSSYMSGATRVAPEAEQAQNFGNDSVELSTGAKEYAQLVKAAREAMTTSETQEDIRADEIMKQINSGTYGVTTDQVAQSIMGSANIPVAG